MVKRKSKHKPIGKKGELQWDEGANQKLIKPTQETGFKVNSMPPELRGQKITDKTFLSTVMKKRMPIVTDDHTSYKEADYASNATAFIMHAPVSKDNEEYILKWKSFFAGHTSTTLAGFYWEIPLTGDIIKKPIKKR